MKSVMNYNTAVAPTMTAPRAHFNLSSGHKTTIDFDYIYPIWWHMAYPGDTITVNPAVFARLATPIHPLMDNMYLDIHWFSASMRILWDNTRKFFGEQVDPGDSIDYTIPMMTAPASTGYAELSLADYFGLPTKVPDYEHSALPMRLYAQAYNEWFRDQNLIDSVTVSTADGPDTTTSKVLLKRGKRHDYFTSALLSPQKSVDGAVDLPLGTVAPINGIGTLTTNTWPNTNVTVRESGGSGTVVYASSTDTTTTNPNHIQIEEDPNNAGYPGVFADLTNATAATILQLREAMAIQSLLELDARAGTRYNEIVYSIFGVTMIDLTYRPEFLGGGSTRIGVQQVPQTSNDGTNGSVGQLAGFGTGFLEGGGFTKSFTEHSIIIGVISARADLTYQQGLNKLWSLETRYDYLYPILQNIGDDTILVKELYCQDPATDTGSTGTPDNERVFGYQERYAELKYIPSLITGLFRSNCTSSLEAWHLSEEFASLPSLDQTFIEQNTPVDRAIVTSTEPHLIVDCYFNVQAARPMHMYSIPGMGARF